MTRAPAAAILAMFVSACATSPPPPGFLCGDRTTIAEAITQAGERHAAIGLEHGGTRVIELWTSPAAGSFTVTATNQFGARCVLTTGGQWHEPWAKP